MLVTVDPLVLSACRFNGKPTFQKLLHRAIDSDRLKSCSQSARKDVCTSNCRGRVCSRKLSVLQATMLWNGTLQSWKASFWLTGSSEPQRQSQLADVPTWVSAGGVLAHFRGWARWLLAKLAKPTPFPSICLVVPWKNQ